MDSRASVHGVMNASPSEPGPISALEQYQWHFLFVADANTSMDRVPHQWQRDWNMASSNSH